MRFVILCFCFLATHILAAGPSTLHVNDADARSIFTFASRKLQEEGKSRKRASSNEFIGALVQKFCNKDKCDDKERAKFVLILNLADSLDLGFPTVYVRPNKAHTLPDGDLKNAFRSWGEQLQKLMGGKSFLNFLGHNRVSPTRFFVQKSGLFLKDKSTRTYVPNAALVGGFSAQIAALHYVAQAQDALANIKFPKDYESDTSDTARTYRTEIRALLSEMENALNTCVLNKGGIETQIKELCKECFRKTDPAAANRTVKAALSAQHTEENKQFVASFQNVLKQIGQEAVLKN